MRLGPDTHEQAMACLSCFLAGWTPPEHFPQEAGLWSQPCPSCGKRTVWVTEPRRIDPDDKTGDQ